MKKFKYEMENIICKGCKKRKKVSNYTPSNLKGRNYLCKECSTKYKRGIEKNRISYFKKQIIENIKKVKCIKCNEKQLISNFYVSNLKKSYYVCKKCSLILQKQRLVKRREVVNKMIDGGEKIKCRMCNKNKLISEFYRESVVQHDYLCKLCFAAKRSKYAKENRPKINKRNKLKRKTALVKWLEYFKLKGWDVCSKCGYNKCFWAIEFHHKNSKEKKLRINHFYNLHSFIDTNIKKLNVEAKKCVILCANCHREEHYKN